VVLFPSRGSRKAGKDIIYMCVCVCVCKARSFRGRLVEKNLLQVVSGLSFVAALKFLLLLLFAKLLRERKLKTSFSSRSREPEYTF
jgi:hypothetical protein